MSEHAKYSPSSFDRVIDCPGSVRQSAGMPNRSSRFADEGTMAHEMAATILGGSLIVVEDYPDIADANVMLDHVLLYTGHVFDLQGSPPPPQFETTLLVEQRVRLDDEVWGTADAIVWSPSTKTLFVRDLKYGAGIVVEVENNTQLKLYALMALLTFGYPARTVDIGIVQPRAFHEDGPIRTVVYEAIDLIDFWHEVDAAVRRSKDPKAPLIAGDGCRFCPASPTCPEALRSVQAVAKTVFAPASTYSPHELAKAIDWLPMVEGWVKNVRQFAYEEAEGGRCPPGYKLVEKVARRKWRDDVVDTDMAAQLACAVEELYEDPKFKGIGDIERLAPGGNAKARAAALAPFTVKESSGHVLAPEDDTRPAIRVDAKAAFAGTPQLLNVD